MRGELVLHLLAGAVDVGVVLGHAPDAGQAVHHAGLLVAVDRAELEEPQRQFAVGAAAGPEDQVVHGAVHRLEVVVLAGLAHGAVLVQFRVDVHRREHALAVPVQVAGDLVEVALGDVRGVDEVVAGIDVALAGVVLHGLADNAALGVEDRQAGAELVREGEQVQFRAELAVVAALGLGNALLVGLERVLGGPGGAVDALQLLVVLVAQPVGGRGTGQGKGVGDQLGVRQVRAAAQIAPDAVAALAVHVVVNGDVAGADLDVDALSGLGGVILPAQQFELVGLVLHRFAGLVLGHHAAHELLVLVDDLLHHLFELAEVFRGERFRDVEVEVEAVRDVGADAELGVGAQLLHGLGHDVGRGVAQDVEPVRGINGDGLDIGVLGKGLVQVLQLAVNAGHNDVAALKEEFRAGGPGSHLGLFAVDEKGDLLGI